jgi:predicted patatin/cPLA2 family phospholipase
MNECALILEGGGMRGIHTAGILDYFLDKKLEFPAVFGVSAGAIHALNYIARQRGRSLRVNMNYMNDKRYMGMRTLMKTGDLVGVKFCYQTIPEELDLFDYEMFANNPSKLYVVVSNLETGEAEYIECKNAKKDLGYVRASASLPLISRIVGIRGKKLLDGGICDSIPVKQAEEMGYHHNVAILTREEGYVKEQIPTLKMMRGAYRKYPKFVEAAANRHIKYNETTQWIKEQEEAGKLFVIRPKEPIAIGRLERNLDKMQEVYDAGYALAEEIYPALMEYLKAGEVSGETNEEHA